MHIFCEIMRFILEFYEKELILINEQERHTNQDQTDR